MALVRRQRQNFDIWPGFVDALATLLMVIIFLLMIFVVSQLYLNEALVGRDQALDRLNRQIADMAEQLNLERAASDDLRANVESLSSQLRSSLARRDEIERQVSALRQERNAILARLENSQEERGQLTAVLRDLETRLAESETLISERDQELSQSRDALEDAFATIEADKETIQAQLGELDQLSQDIDALQALRDELLTSVADLEAANQVQEAELLGQEEQLEEQAAELQSRLRAIDEQTEAALLARAEAARLAQQIEALNAQIGELAALLDASEKKDAEQQAQIVDLGRRLNVALASQVQELARYRSEFFGKLRQILGNRRDIQVVGDRFVFQSEVLFDQGSDALGVEGQLQMGQLARTLIEISSDIPAEINWVLRVDGHTDKIPISTARFPSNWELSTARAISVVKFLKDQGIPASRLAATGFAEFQPLDPRDDEIALRRNRRIELKLTER
ncbi:MAG: peptidoglycan -binding protein [Alphaproteobacteria bacterium]|nr:peptidoglycan -binding protein [Alphaproteobacteria bacterium]